MTSLRSNLNASRPPTAIDAEDKGYGIGSRWHDLAHSRTYTCTIQTKNAAVWIEDYATADQADGVGLWESASSITSLTTAEDIDMQQKELIAAAFETLTTVEREALSPVTSQLCYDTDDSHLYINI